MFDLVDNVCYFYFNLIVILLPTCQIECVNLNVF